MFGWLRYRYDLPASSSQEADREILLKTAAEHEEAEQNQELEDAFWAQRSLIDIIDDDIAQLLSTYLQSETQRLYLPVPGFNTQGGKWEKSDVSGRHRLSQSAIVELRSAIRAEKKERSELARSWLTSIAGLIGVLIGLFAIILGRR